MVTHNTKLLICLSFLLRVIVNVVHSTSGCHSKTIRFLNVAFSSSGDSLLAGDHQGNIYVFELMSNRWVLPLYLYVLGLLLFKR